MQTLYKEFESAIIGKLLIQKVKCVKMSRKIPRPKNVKIKRNYLNHFIIMMLLLFSLLLIVCILLLNVLPAKYCIALCVGIALIDLLVFFLLKKKRKKKRKAVIYITRTIAVLLSIAMMFASLMVYDSYATIKNISGANTKTITLSVIVLSESSAEKLKDLKTETFGLRGVIDLDNTDYAVSEINDQLNTTITTDTYNDFDSMIDALYDEDVEAIVLNENYRTLIEESDSDFSTKTIVIDQIQRTVAIDSGNTSDASLTDSTFNMLISGIDTYGDIDTSGRSDVNMLVTVNPTTKEILLTSIPRDFYAPLYGNAKMYDKLTHSGLYGIDCTMQTVASLLDTKIDYYIRVNFSSVIDIVDALGGIQVDSLYNFSIDKYTFKKGTQNLSGEAALMFARCRKDLPNGDRDRIKNQQLVMMGIIDKLISPSIVMNYSSLLGAISGTFETNLSASQISSLIQMQLTDMSDWTITQQYLNGSDARKTTYTNSDELLYVMVAYQSTVEDSAEAIAAMFSPDSDTQTQTTGSK